MTATEEMHADLEALLEPEDEAANVWMNLAIEGADPMDGGFWDESIDRRECYNPDEETSVVWTSF